MSEVQTNANSPDAAPQEQLSLDQQLLLRQQQEADLANAAMNAVAAKQKDLGDEDFYTIERFEPQIGTSLEIVAGTNGERVEAKIVEARILRQAPEGVDFRDTLSVVVQVPGRLDQRFFEVEHPILGTFGMFLVAISQNEDGTVQHQAVYG